MELGFGDNTERKSPTPLVSLQSKKVDQVIAGAWYTVCIAEPKPQNTTIEPVSNSIKVYESQKVESHLSKLNPVELS